MERYEYLFLVEVEGYEHYTFFAEVEGYGYNFAEVKGYR